MKIYQSYASDFNFTVQSRNDNNRLITWLTSSSHSLYTIVTSISPVLLPSSRAVYIYIYIYNIYIFFFSIIVIITYYLYACIFIFIYIFIYVLVSVCVFIIRVQCRSVCVSVLIARRVIELGRWASAVFRTFSIVIECLYAFLCPTKIRSGKMNPVRVKNRKSIAKQKKTWLHRTTSSPPSHFSSRFSSFPFFSPRFSLFPRPPSSTLLAPTLGFPPHDHRWWSSKNCSVQ